MSESVRPRPLGVDKSFNIPGFPTEEVEGSTRCFLIRAKNSFSFYIQKHVLEQQHSSFEIPLPGHERIIERTEAI